MCNVYALCCLGLYHGVGVNRKLHIYHLKCMHIVNKCTPYASSDLRTASGTDPSRDSPSVFSFSPDELHGDCESQLIIALIRAMSL